MPTSQNEEKQNPQSISGYIFPMSTTMKYSIMFSVCVILILFLITQLYRYTLVGKAISSEQYTTALALTSPEIGFGVSYLTSSLL